MTYQEKLAEYERRKKALREQDLTPMQYHRAIDALCRELGV
jgi:hypothetical protein